jgi:hypothetical protein
VLHCTYAILTRWNSTGYAGNFCILHRCPAHTQRCPVQPTAPNLRQPTFKQGPRNNSHLKTNQPLSKIRIRPHLHSSLLYSTLRATETTESPHFTLLSTTTKPHHHYQPHHTPQTFKPPHLQSFPSSPNSTSLLSNF